jgi:MFS family permease
VALLVVVFLGQIAIAPGQSLISVYVEAELGRSPAFTSNLLSTRVVFGAIAALVGGGLADAYGRKRVMAIGASGLPIVGIAFLLRSPLALILLWAYVGFSLGLYTLGRQAYILALVPTHRLGVAFAIIFTGVTLGGAGGNLVAAPLISGWGFGTLGLFTITVGAIVFVTLALAIPERKASQSDQEEAALISYRSLLRRPRTLLMLALQAVPTAYYGAAVLLMPLLIFRVSGQPSHSALYGTLSLVFSSVAQLVAGRLMDRHGAKGPLAVLVVGIAGSALLTVPLAESLIGLFFCGITGVSIAWALSVAYPVLVRETCPKPEHARMLGLLYLAWSVGMLVGTQLGGFLVDWGGGVPFLVLGVANVLMVPLALKLLRDRQGAESASG